MQSEEDPSHFVESLQTIYMSISSGLSTASFHSTEGTYRAAKKIFDQIADFLVICGEGKFGEKLQEIKNMLDRWSLGGGALGQGGSVEIEGQ